MFFFADLKFEMQGAALLPQNPQQGFSPPANTTGNYNVYKL